MDPLIASKIESIKSELSAQLSSIEAGLISQIDSIISEKIKEISISESSPNTPLKDDERGKLPPDPNYFTNAKYLGSDVKFGITGGQVFTPEENDLVTDLEFIQFGGEGGGDFAFRLFPTSTSGNNPQPRIGVQYGEINGTPPSGMSQSEPFLLDCGTAKIWVEIGFNLLNGSISSRVINFGSSVPNNSISGTGANIHIGDVIFENETYTVKNQFYVGNINIRKYDICENGTPKSDYIFIGGNTPNLP